MKLVKVLVFGAQVEGGDRYGVEKAVMVDVNVLVSLVGVLQVLYRVFNVIDGLSGQFKRLSVAFKTG